MLFDGLFIYFVLIFFFLLFPFVLTFACICLLFFQAVCALSSLFLCPVCSFFPASQFLHGFCVFMSSFHYGMALLSLNMDLYDGT